MKQLLPLFLLLLTATLAKGQTEHVFRSGLVVADCHRYGREAVVTDRLAYELYTGQLKKPVANGKLFTNDKGFDVEWKPIEVDSTGRFRGRALGNGYIYLTYQSKIPRTALLNVSGNSMLYFNGEPHGGDIYNDGWMNIPVSLKKGVNEILIRCGNFSRWQGVSARLKFPAGSAMISMTDATLPHVIIGKSVDSLMGAVVVTNLSNKSLTGLSIVATLNGQSTSTPVPAINPLSLRKVRFYFSPASIKTKGDHTCRLQLMHNGKIQGEGSLAISAVNEHEHQSHTFISGIDGSVQYFSVAPRLGEARGPSALFLSVHGAGVEAIGQARAYKPKDWGVLVAPTNRRPRGFNWEDWGRIDALEVLDLAIDKYKPDPKRIYLTGHSMGGHGTWYLGATYPDKWAAIAPCAGYPTLTGYGSADGKIPEEGQSEVEKTLLRASNGSNVLRLSDNYKGLGVYIHHGDSDKVVSVNYARQMREILGRSHSDFSYYEYPGGSHWFGSESVDWPPLFDFFKWHTIKPDSAADVIDFVTVNPAISSSYKWASIMQQNRSLEYSTIRLRRDKKQKTIKGSTENTALLKLELDQFSPGDTILVLLDSISIRHVVVGQVPLYLKGYPKWEIGEAPDAKHKNSVRTGTFKEAFNHKMVFVYGTSGDVKENAWAFNKARYDAEVWYYRGNGAIDVVADKDFSLEKFKDRGVVLYGNSETNSAWRVALKDCPIGVTRDQITAGSQVFAGKDLATYFTWPRHDSATAMIAVVSGTGLTGMRAADGNQYFAAGSGFPDYVIFSADMLKLGSAAIRAAGFYDNQWNLKQ